jgi:chloramphenicol 3-O-phosphotransferase
MPELQSAVRDGLALMPRLIFIGGSPGSGKTTVSRILHEKFRSVMIDFGILREIHLDNGWTNQSEKEERMAFENLIFILRNYLRNGYKNIIVNDLRDFRVRQIPELFAPEDFLIATLVVKDDEILRARVLDPVRDSGWRDAERAIEWNRAVIDRPAVENEYKLDNTLKTPEQIALEIIDLLNLTE